ncbi:MAG TPA: hypothetical protein VNH82_07350 [Candidatus Dormibacteraeota bacterium]|nr:hypothetical protein [Candidatus Dormibacteraeota bacterium]
MGDPRVTEHLGGPESPDKLRVRRTTLDQTLQAVRKAGGPKSCADEISRSG